MRLSKLGTIDEYKTVGAASLRIMQPEGFNPTLWRLKIMCEINSARRLFVFERSFAIWKRHSEMDRHSIDSFLDYRKSKYRKAVQLKVMYVEQIPCLLHASHREQIEGSNSSTLVRIRHSIYKKCTHVKQSPERQVQTDVNVWRLRIFLSPMLIGNGNVRLHIWSAGWPGPPQFAHSSRLVGSENALIDH